MEYNHFLITRFNLRNPKWVSDKKNTPVLTDQWHENRFKLFNDFCFESEMIFLRKYKSKRKIKIIK